MRPEKQLDAGLLIKLRESTQPAHDKVEHALGERLFSPNLTKGDYANLLRKFYQIYLTTEAEIERHGLLTDMLQKRSKLTLLNADFAGLGDLGGEPSAAPKPFVLASEADALGAMYVIEGSTLGGAVIAKRLQSLPWIKKESHLNFFTSYGKDKASMWQQFLQFLTSYGTQFPEREDAVVSGAMQTFAEFHRQLNQ